MTLKAKLRRIYLYYIKIGNLNIFVILLHVKYVVVHLQPKSNVKVSQEVDGYVLM